ncbi:putative membrane protein [Cetobacterium ceti]|uniref:Putative membrane protein n=2 Tax=Cetobacterium ceti TaxID=180163 RepID=A0A1T4MCU2_9FUSO|nr:putative membrane protein [Cetobacterium ceti]
MYMDYYGGMWMFPFFGIIVFVIIIVLIFKGISGNKSNENIFHSESALEILNKRYAKGEISKEEYEEMKKTILK